MGFATPSAGHAESAPFRVERRGTAVRLSGRLRTRDAAALFAALRDAAKDGALQIDLAGVEELEGGIAALLADVGEELGVAVADGADGKEGGQRWKPLLDLYTADGASPKPKPRKPEGTIAHVGRATLDVVGELSAIVSFVGEMAFAVARVVRRPRSGHFREVPYLVEKAGADAVPIVLLINFLVGFVMAYQSARELKIFGANVYVADLVGISVTRELAPLMTAIIVCGRSGAAFAAEIGSMKVDEEVDALRTLGLQPVAWLVIPRVLALIFVVPILTLLADVFGVLGGMLVAMTSLDLTPQGYLIETRTAVFAWDVESGILKSVAFAIAIAFIACQQGFAASGGAEGVGRRTTSTVVTSLFALVVLDAVFTMVFRLFGS